mmetsp:Transcript_12961/g.24070  ORF Transcript_12961/g.24070 Transcript_12961/m.24070 type:complete len:448 (+) Transcript_12961:35-1378(+)
MSLQVVGKAPALPKHVQGFGVKEDTLKDSRPGAATNYDLRTLRHANLENDPTFSELKGKLEEYLEDKKLPPARQKVMPYKSSSWREVLFNSLLVLLSEVTFTNDEHQQQILLTRVKKWYDEKTAPPSPLPPIIKRKDAVRPSSKRLSKSETPLKERKVNLELKKLDAIPSIESRTPSPTKTAKLPRLVVSLDSRTFADKRANILDEVTEAKLSSRYIEFRERELLEMKATSTRNKVLKKYGTDRSRFDEISAFKAEQARVVFKKLPEEPTPPPKEDNVYYFKTEYNLSSETIDTDNKMTRVAQLRKLRADQLNIDDSPETPVNRTFAESLSIYANKQDLSFLQSTFRPVTPGALDMSRSSRVHSLSSQRKQIPERLDGLADLYEIKKKLAKYNIPCTMRTLETGLVKPNDLPSEQLNSLPSGGEMLMINPLDSLAKGGKKGKKKRSK